MPAVILVTNDDGVHAAGLYALAASLDDLGDVYVVAPDREQSTVGHALTLHRPLRVTQVGERRFAVNGTPSDCVTVSAAMEGTLLGVPSMAVSQANAGDTGFESAGAVARLVASRLLVEGLPAKTLLNVNAPAGPASGIRMTRLGHRVYREKIVQETDPRGLPYYWIGAGPPEWNDDEGSDISAVNRGQASVTPLHLDLTHYGALGRMADWESGLNSLLKK